MSSQVIATILRHDSKVTSYKIALLRSINNTVTTFPDLRTCQQDVAVPLRLLAEFWGFVDADRPIAQGQHSQRDGKTRNDMSFRPALSQFRTLWEQHIGGLSSPADGFVKHRQYRNIRPNPNITPDASHAPTTKLRIPASKLPVAATIDPGIREPPTPPNKTDNPL